MNAPPPNDPPFDDPFEVTIFYPSGQTLRLAVFFQRIHLRPATVWVRAVPDDAGHDYDFVLDPRAVVFREDKRKVIYHPRIKGLEHTAEMTDWLERNAGWPPEEFRVPI